MAGICQTAVEYMYVQTDMRATPMMAGETV